MCLNILGKNSIMLLLVNRIITTSFRQLLFSNQKVKNKEAAKEVSINNMLSIVFLA